MEDSKTNDAGAAKYIQGIEIDEKVQAAIIRVCDERKEAFEGLGPE